MSKRKKSKASAPKVIRNVVRKQSKKSQKGLRKQRLLRLDAILIAVGILNGLSVLGYHFYSLQKAAAAYPEEIATTTQSFTPEQFSHNAQYRPVLIKIGSLIEKTITPQEYKNGVWTIGDTTVAHLVTSAFPYEPNNIILYGHNTTAVFANLKKVKTSDVITLKLANGTTRNYVVQTIVEITPDKIEYLQPTTTETLTIYTCSGFMDRKRLIVRAVPQSIY